ncbi:hypothetical protein TrRE_jg9514 [Triparma retinervis]|uniref:Uncharacterized protein n=1 Tax=Triparma retinervis TaxID=2557542 RepID=A0A9W7CEN0_9STRA|nr:hypothetical protein TrRE_jg9514 [Triparma retinervis]
MVDVVLDMIKDVGRWEVDSGKDAFSQVAESISVCDETREKGGSVGWVDRFGSERPTDAVFPASGVDLLYGKGLLKPGDVHNVETSAGFHVVQVLDVQTDLRSSIRQPSPKLKGGGYSTRTSGNENPTTYTLQTNGCQMNVADSERLRTQLQSSGLSEVEKKPDVVVVNTCSIRDHAEQKLYDYLGPFAKRKREGDPVTIVVTGCVAQQEGESLIRRVPEVDLVVGPQYINRVGDLLEDVKNGYQIVATDPTLISEDQARPVRDDPFRAWVPVINGCNEHCSYCVVPNTRGVEQSRTLNAIVGEMRDLKENGYKEITLLGQNIDAYGRDLKPKSNFADLLKVADGVGLDRVRYVTSHPRYFSDKVVDAVRDLKSVCEQFHLPPQAGSDSVLSNMRRGYTFDSYMRIVRRIKDRCGDDAGITGDIIVGFPGETEEDFQRTLDLLEAVKYDNLNAFAYSPRPYTDAALASEQVDEDVKADRLQRVQRLAVKHGMERSERYLGREVEVLVEGRNKKVTQEEECMGKTRQGRQVFFEGDVDELIGKLVFVKIDEARPWSLRGTLVNVK